MIRLYLDARGHLPLHGVFKFPFERVFIIVQGKLAPAQSPAACQRNTDRPFYLAIAIEIEERRSDLNRLLVTGDWRPKNHGALISLTNALSWGMLPMQFAKSCITFAGIEELFLSVDLHDRDFVV